MSKIKMKTHKGLKKRIKLTAKGKLRHKHSNTGHLMSGKSGKRRRALRKPAILKGALGKRLRVALGNG